MSASAAASAADRVCGCDRIDQRRVIVDFFERKFLVPQLGYERRFQRATEVLVDFAQQLVAGAGDDSAVQLGVSLSVDSTIAGIDGRLLSGKKLSQPRDLFGRPALRGQMGGLLLERRPHFNRFVETSPLHPASERCRKLARRTHVSAVADARFDHPGMN